MSKFKHILAFLLLAVFAFQILGKTVIYISYILNQDYIAKNICENRAKPQLHCNGKCHLYKELKKAESNDQTAPGSKKITESSELFHELNETTLMKIEGIEKQQVFAYNLLLPAPKCFGIFHPPQA